MIKKALEKRQNFPDNIALHVILFERVNSKEKAIKLLYSNNKNSTVQLLQSKGETVLFPGFFTTKRARR